MPDTHALRVALRRATSSAAWSVGERAFQTGRVTLRSRRADASEFVFAVTIGPNLANVTLWPSDADWDVEPEPPTRGSAHAVAALHALESGVDELEAAPVPPQIVVALTTAGGRLALAAFIEERGARRPAPVPLPSSLPSVPLLDHVLRTARAWAGSQVPPRAYKPLLDGLLQAGRVELDGVALQPSKVGLDVIAVVDRFGDGFRLRLEDDPAAERVFEGEPTLIVGNGRLQPRGYGRLNTLERHRLATPTLYRAHELAMLSAARLPQLESMIRVERRDDVPATSPADLVLRLDAVPFPGGVEIQARIVYGDPPVAEVLPQGCVPLGGLHQVPARDLAGEHRRMEQLRRELGLRPGERRHLRGIDGARFVRDRLPRFLGTVFGSEHLERFTTRADLSPVASLQAGRLDAHFVAEGALVGLKRVLDAWERGDELVELPGGGFSALPSGWLAAHGTDAGFLLEAGSGLLPPHLAGAAAALLQTAGAPTPPELERLVAVLRGSEGIPHLPAPDGLHATLREYQQVGWSWLHTMEELGLSCVLADDMGLGKTLQTLTMILAGKSRGPTLVIAPTSVLHNWLREAERFTPDLATALLHGGRRDGTYDALAEGRLDLVVTSYGVLRQDIDRLAALRLRCVVLDEAQAIKNPDAQTSKAARRLHAEHRLALTGTPIENRLSELWSLFEFLQPGFFGGRARFEETLGAPASAGDERAMTALRGRVRPFLLRRKKSEVEAELPPRTDVVLRCPMSPGQRAAYEAARRGGLLGLGDDPRPKRLAVLEVLTRLRQASCHAGLLPGGDAEAESGKLDVLLETLDELVQGGHAALVFSQWTSLLDLVEPRLGRAGISFLRLDGSTRDRGALVDAFQAPDGPPVFLISLKAGGTGLNLTRADHVVLLDPWWNPAVEQQATDRAHRIGQERPVFAWRLVSEGTVEERVLAMQDRKRALADAVLEGQGVGGLSDDELLALLDPLED